MLFIKRILASIYSYFFAEKDFQTRNNNFMINNFGFSNTFDKEERALRLVHQAIEVAKASGISTAQLHKLVIFAYQSQPKEIDEAITDTCLETFNVATANAIRLVSETEFSLFFKETSEATISNMRKDLMFMPKEIRSKTL